MNRQNPTLEQEFILGGADATEAADLAALARRLPEVRQLPLLATPPSLRVVHRATRRHLVWRRFSLAAVLGSAVAGAVVVAAVMVAAAQPAVPGDALYPLKRASETVAVKLQPDFHDEMMMRRADEVGTLVARGSQPALISATLTSYNTAVQQDPAGSYAARDYCAGMLKSAAAHSNPAIRAQIQTSLSHLNLDLDST